MDSFRVSPSSELVPSSHEVSCLELGQRLRPGGQSLLPLTLERSARAWRKGVPGYRKYAEIFLLALVGIRPDHVCIPLADDLSRFEQPTTLRDLITNLSIP